MKLFERCKGNRKRTAIVSLAALSAISIMSFGAYSFFTDQETIVNEFSVGRVDVTVTESNWNPEDGDGVNIHPGYTRLKNPAVKNTAGVVDNDAYIKATIRILDKDGNQVTDEARDELIFSTLRYDPEGTLKVSDGNGEGSYDAAAINALPNVNPVFKADTLGESETGKHVFYMDGTLKSAATADAGDEATLFTTVALASDLTNEQMELMGDYKVEVLFDGIQTKGFSNVTEAMTALLAESAAE